MLACFIQNVLRSTLLHANKTTKKLIQFLINFFNLNTKLVFFRVYLTILSTFRISWDVSILHSNTMLCNITYSKNSNAILRNSAFIDHASRPP